MTVREGDRHDIDAVRRACEAAYDDVLVVETIDRAMVERYSAAVVRERVDRAAGRVLVETADAKPDGAAGCVDVLLRDGDAVIDTANVHPDWWREGAGGRLLDRALSPLVDAGAARVRARACALAANDVGRSFCEARGYSVVARGADDLFGETVSAVTYVRELRV